MELRSLTVIAILSLFLAGCSGGPTEEADTTSSAAPTPVASAEPAEAMDPMTNKGIGPITSVTLDPIDDELVKSGEEFFKAKCAACHRIDKRRVGPALAGIMERRTPEWTMNMIMNPTEMLEKDPIAQELLAEYAAPMGDQNVSESEARAILEFLRTKPSP